MYPIDRRKQAKYIYSLGHSIRKTAILLNVSSSTVHRWLKHPVPKQYCRSQPSKASVIVDSIRLALLNDPFLSCQKLQALVAQLFNFKVSTTLIHTAIKKSGLTKKKARRFSSPSNLEQKTQAFLNMRESFKSQGMRFVSLDETSFGRNGVNARGYAPKGKKLLLKRLQPTMQTTSVMALVSDLAVIQWEARKGSFDGISFCNFLRRLNLPADTVMLLDNVRFHYTKDAVDIAASRGWHLLFVPPYSPWFNPIEGCFSIIKRHYVQHLSIPEAMNSLTPDHLQAFFNHSLNITQMPES
jgi:transposase